MEAGVRRHSAAGGPKRCGMWVGLFGLAAISRDRDSSHSFWLRRKLVAGRMLQSSQHWPSRPCQSQFEPSS
jgi:hypothetical protein